MTDGELKAMLLEVLKEVYDHQLTPEKGLEKIERVVMG